MASEVVARASAKLVHRLTWTIAFAMALMLCTQTSAAFAVMAPHVANSPDTDACAMCHRTHTASGDTTWFALSDSSTQHSALTFGTTRSLSDTELCYVCHGVDSLGATTDIQSPFLGESTHTLAPYPSDYGPSPKSCSSCHDSHGTERDTDGDPYAALLRARSIVDTATIMYKGDAYCATCHVDRPADTWDGLAVWQLTAHSKEITPPASGTDIVCTVCHEPHGSNNPPLIRELMYPPAAATTTTIPANDRWLCFACHGGGQATYDGGLPYQVSTHGLSEATVTPTGEWVSAEMTRTVGECQTCHAPMGRSDGAGGVVPKLAQSAGPTLCYTCHTTGSKIASDLAGIAYPSTSATDLEIAVTFDAATLASNYARLSVYSREGTGTRGIVGPREFRELGASGARSGDVAVGSVYGDGKNQVVVADPVNDALVVYSDDGLGSLSPTVFPIDSTPTFVGVGDVFLDGSARPEIVVVSRADTTPFASTVSIYRYNGSTVQKVAGQGPIALGDDATGLAIGRLTGGATADDVAVTLAGSTAGALRILVESGSVTDSITVSPAYLTRRGPRGPSIGDAWDNGGTTNEIVVANSGEVTDTVSVFDAAGNVLGSYDATGAAGSAVAYDTLVSDVLPGVGGAETVVALRSADDTSAIVVFPRLSGGGLGTAQTYATGRYYQSGSLTSGDVNGDSYQELLVGNAGTWTRSTTTKMAPSVQVFSANSADSRTTLASSPLLFWGGGTELAGTPPAMAVADLGPIGESRHPVESAATASHVSTETNTMTRHVDCNDCHNVHEATSTPVLAPTIYGASLGTWGVSISRGALPGSTVYTQNPAVRYEYELCFKCHSAWTVSAGTAGDIASQVDTRNASFHAVETAASNAQATSGSFVATTPAWTNSSVMYCIDCHTNSNATVVKGPHTSVDAPILGSPYWGQRSNAQASLCYDCHKYSVYYTGADDGDDGVAGTSYSMFYDGELGNGAIKLHRLHSYSHGYGCDACHTSHGSDKAHLIRSDLDYTTSATGGTCVTDCHSTGTPATTHVYTRQ